MIDPSLERELTRLLGGLAPDLQRRVLEFARALAASGPGAALAAGAIPPDGTLTQADAEAMRKAAASDDRADLLDW
jgi:hypothetical protein